MAVVSSKPTQHTSVGDLTLQRHDTPQEFDCTHCGKPKKSKNVAIWNSDTGFGIKMCNGCYGEVLSKEPKK